ncbi:hypothetical protein GGR50DRAFT_246220 [Xylaria sp. CBS 124048]|nr:hypothetical protein GGR50DRAFT_246220 [Xylaria sp. CBS 124048]
MAAAVHDANSAVMDAEDTNGHKAAASCDHATPFRSKTRSLSDGNGSQWSPLPFAIDPSRKKSKDDSMLGSDRNEDQAFPPATPLRPRLPAHGLSLQMLSRDASSPVQPSYMKPAPLSPMVDHSHIYASPTNILPRRSRGLDFSRAATSLHHSTLAEQSSPDSSPTIGGRAMNIPRRSNGGYGAEQSATRLRSIMGSNDRMHMSSSVGSVNPIPSDSSSSCDEDDPMDDEMEDAILSTPQVAKDGSPGQNLASVPWMPSASPSISSLSGFRTRPRKQFKKKLRGLASLSYNLALPRSPPRNPAVKDLRDSPMAQPRRDSISWAANQLHISGLDNEERSMESVDPLSTTPSRDGARGVIKKVVTRRGNLLPKTKGFARIRAALAEEGAPVDSEVRREAEVIRQVRESDMDLEPRTALGRAPPSFSVSNLTTAQSSPKLNTAQESSDEIPDDDQMSDFLLSSSFKQQAVKNSKGKNFWDVFSETGSVSGMRITPPPITLPRGSSSGISEDVNMDSPSMSAGSGSISLPGLGMGIIGYGSDSQKAGTPQPTASATPAQGAGNAPPTAAEITRRIHYKRRREDDFDPHVFKRRAVSPGMSAHNSPIMQSPLQRDSMPWGSRPGSNHGGDKISGTPSENGSSAGNSGGTSNTGRPIAGGKGRVGFQGMNDTNDGLMRMSIE